MNFIVLYSAGYTAVLGKYCTFKLMYGKTINLLFRVKLLG